MVKTILKSNLILIIVGFGLILTYDKTFNEVHKLTVLLGTEAIRDGLGRTLKGRRYNYFVRG